MQESPLENPVLHFSSAVFKTESPPRQKFTIHPLAAKFPDIPLKEFQELKNSIKTDGQLSPIVINEADQILEGRHRYQACQELGIEPTTIQFRDVLGEKFGQVSEAKFIFDSNYHRRHLSDDQRVALCAAFLPELRAKTKRGRPAKIKDGQTVIIKNEEDPKGTVRDQLADIAKVGETKAKKAIDLADADPALLGQVSRGEKKLAEAHNELSDKPSKPAGQSKKLEHWQLTRKIEKTFDRFLDKLLPKVDPSQHREALRLLADACTARMEKLEEANHPAET
jgi:hypothetical protein